MNKTKKGGENIKKRKRKGKMGKKKEKKKRNTEVIKIIFIQI